MCSDVGQHGQVDADVARCLDDEGRIALDLPCSKCRYNLHAAGLDDACPECGTPVRETLRPDLLMFAEPRRTKRLQFGAWFLTGVILLSLLTHGDFYFTVLWFLTSGYPRWALIVWTPVKLLEKSVAIAGVLCLTVTGLPQERAEPRFSARRLARWGVVAWLAVYVVVLLLDLVADISLSRVVNLELLFWCVCHAFGLLGYLAMAGYAAHLVRRVPDDRMARQAKSAVIGWAITMALAATISTVQVYLARTYTGRADLSNTWWTTLAVCDGLATLAGLVFSICMVILLVRFGRRLGVVRRIAAEIGRKD